MDLGKIHAVKLVKIKNLLEMKKVSMTYSKYKTIFQQYDVFKDDDPQDALEELEQNILMVLDKKNK